MKKSFFIIALAYLAMLSCSKSDEVDQGSQSNPENVASQINLDNASCTFTSDGGGGVITFTTNTSWSATVADYEDEEWCSIMPSSGAAGSNKIIVTASANESYDNRAGTIVINAGNAKRNVKVLQGQKDAIVFAEHEYEFGFDGGALDFEILTNVDISVTISNIDKSWIKQVNTRGLETKNLYFDISKSYIEEDREGKITITGGDVEQSVIVRQKGIKEIVEKERAALIAFYNATGGDNWNNNENWCSDKPIDEWYGVGVSYGQISEINLSGNNLTGEVTDELDSLQNLYYLQLDGNSISKLSVSNCPKLSSIYIDNNQLYSLELSNCEELQTIHCPDGQLDSLRLSGCNKLEYLNCDNNQLKTLDVSNHSELVHLSCRNNQIHTLNASNCTKLYSNNFYNNPLQSLDLSNCIDLKELSLNDMNDNATLRTLNVSNCSQLEKLGCIRNQLQMLNISGCVSLSNLQCHENQLQALDVSDCVKLKLLYCYSNQLQSLDVTSNVKLMELHASNNPNLSKIYIVPEQDFEYSIDSNTSFAYKKDYGFYESTDYSQDGVVKQLQQATKGTGIDIVMMGDGFSDRLIADGTYENVIKTAIEGFFAEEPYKSFRDYFNVYIVTAVSKNEGYTQNLLNSTVIDCYFGEGTLVGGNDEVVFTYAQKAIEEKRIEDAILVVAINSSTYDGTCYMYYPENKNSDWGNGASVSYFTVDDKGLYMSRTFLHEAGGHGFAKLDDEYGYQDNGKIPEEEIKACKRTKKYGWSKNVDFTNDPTKVCWNYFLIDTRYANDGLGVFEGGITYWTGVWRPTTTSIMESTNSREFNAPSREAIYYRIHKLAYGADWQYDYEKFVEWDAKNRKSASAATRGVPYKSTSFEPTHPPVVINKSWRDEIQK